MTELASPRKAARQHALVRPCDDESSAPGLKLNDLLSNEPAQQVATESEMNVAPAHNRLTLHFVQQDAYKAEMVQSTQVGRPSPDQSGIPSINNLHPSIRVRASYSEIKSASSSVINSAESSPDRNQKTPSPKDLRSSFGFRGGVRKKRDVMQAGWDENDSERYDNHERADNDSALELTQVPSPARLIRKALPINTEDLMDELNEIYHSSSNIVESNSSASPERRASLNSKPVNSPVCEMVDTTFPYSPLGVKRQKSNVKPPKTPSGNSRYEPTDTQDGLSATQRVRVGLSEYIGNGTPDKSRLNMEKSPHAGANHCPASCPPIFHASGKHIFSGARASQHHAQEVPPNKLLPSQIQVNCLIGYIRELHQSESSLHVQLAKLKQQADTKLADALARQMFLELELGQARQNILDQQKRIRELIREESHGSGADEYQLLGPDFPGSSGLSDSLPSLAGEMELLYRKSLIQNETVRNQVIRDQERWDGRELFNTNTLTPMKLTSANMAVELSGSAAIPVMSPTIKPLWKPWSSGESDVSLSSRPPMFTIAPFSSDVLPHGLARSGARSSSHPSPCLKSIIQTPGKIVFSKGERLPVFESSASQTQVLSTVESKTSSGLPPLVPVKATAIEQQSVNACNLRSEHVPKFGQHSEPPLSSEPANSISLSEPEKVDKVVICPEVMEKTPITLEKLLLEFYMENDTTKGSMAHVYAKRYQGRESWLFTELSKRYSKEKVDALKERFTKCIQCTTTDFFSAGKDDQRNVYKLNSRLNEVMEQDTRSPLELTDSLSESASINSPIRSPTQKVSPNSRKKPLYRASMTPASHAPSVFIKSFETLKSTSEEPKENEGDLSPDDESLASEMSRVIDSNGESATSAGNGTYENHDIGTKLTASRPFPLQLSTSCMVISKGSPVVRQGELSQVTISPPPASPMAIAKELSSTPRKITSIRQYPTCSITLEALLTDLYRSHQPNELRNVQQVVDEYRGKERELIVMLKSKYGALSVKRLEENLATLEKLAQDHFRRHNQKRFRALKIGAKIVMAVAVGVASCGAGISMVNSRFCHGRFQRLETQQSGNGSSCLVPTDQAFGTDRAASECVMTPFDPVNVFCTEWIDCEESWLTTHSMKDTLKLLKVLPYSPMLEFPYNQLVSSAHSFNLLSILGETAKSVVGVLSEATLLAHNDSALIHLDDSVQEALTKAALASKLLADSTLALVLPSAVNESNAESASRCDNTAGLLVQGVDQEPDLLDWMKQSPSTHQCPRPLATLELSNKDSQPKNDILQRSSDESLAESTESSHLAVCEPVTATVGVTMNICTLEQHLQVPEFYAQDPDTLLALAEQAALAQLSSSSDKEKSQW